MLILIVYLIIALTAATIALTYFAVLFRRFYMKRRYAALDNARAVYSDVLAGEADISALRKNPGTPEWQAIEESLLRLVNMPGRREKALDLFRLLGYVDRYLTMLARGSRWEQAESAYKLGRMEYREAAAQLLKALDSEHHDVRNMAVYALGRIGDDDALKRLIALFERIYDPEADDYSIRIVKSALIAYGDRAAADLAKEMNSTDWRVRASVVDVLGEIPCEASLSALRAGLGDQERDVRCKAAKGLGKAGDRESLGRLTELLDDPYWVVRLHAARALGLIGERSSIQPLKKMLYDPDWQVRKIAAEALGRLGPESFPALMEVSIASEDRYAKDQTDDELERAGVVKSAVRMLLDWSGSGEAAAEGKRLQGWRDLPESVFLDIVRILASRGGRRLREEIRAAAAGDLSWYEVEDAAEAAEKLAGAR